MKRLSALMLAAVVLMPASAQKTEGHGYPITPVTFTKVKVTDSFWGQRLKASREVTIPLAFSKCEETGRYTNFERAAKPSDNYEVKGLSFDDTDVYKTIEGASYSLQTYPDKGFVNYIDSILNIVGRLPLYCAHYEPKASSRVGWRQALVEGGRPQSRVLQPWTHG